MEMKSINMVFLAEVLAMVGTALVISSLFLGIIVFIIGAVLSALCGAFCILKAFENRRRNGYGEQHRPILGLLIVGMISIVGLAVISSESVQTVDAGEVGVVINSPDSSLRGTVLTNGWSFNPAYALSSIEHIRYNTQVSEYIGKDNIDDIDGSVMVLSADQMYIFIDISVSYNIDESKVADLRFKYGSDWKVVVVHQVVRSVPRDLCAGTDALEIVGTQRSVIESAITSKIKQDIETKGGQTTGINVVDVKIREMRIPAGLQSAVEQKIIANQLLEKAQTDLLRIEVEANAEAQKRIIEATADAEVVMIKAKATADAINLVLQQFMDGGGDPDMTAYLAYLYIQALTDPNSNITFVIVPSEGGYLVTIPTGP